MFTHITLSRDKLPLRQETFDSLVFVIAICPIQISLYKECFPTLFCFFLPKPAFLFSHLKHCQLLLLGSPYFMSDYLHLIVRLLPKYSLLILKRISTSVNLSMTQQSDSLCSLYFELPHCPYTSWSCSNTNCIHDFQSNDSSEGKQVKVARVWGLEGMLMQWITESTINWCQQDGVAGYN